MKNIKILRKMTDKTRDSKDRFHHNKIQKLEILLERNKRIIKYKHKLRNRHFEKLTKLKLQLIKTKKLKEKLEIKIKKLKIRKNVLHKAIRKRLRINLIVRKKRLERLKLMGELRAADQKRYLKELREQRKREQRFLKRPKRIHPEIKKLKRKLKISKQKLDLARKDIKSLKFRINRERKKRKFLGVQKWQKKIRKIVKQLKIIKQKMSEIPKENSLQQQVPILNQKTLETDIKEFKAKKKILSREPKIPPQSTPVSLKIPEKSYKTLSKLNTFRAVESNKVINEPLPIGDKQTDFVKKSVRDYKNKFAKLGKKKYKFKEPLPIGDKPDADQEKWFKRKRFSRYIRNRASGGKKSSHTSTSSDGYRKANNYYYENRSNKDGKSHHKALPSTPPKRRSLRSIKLRKRSLLKVAKQSSTDVERETTSLKTSTTNFDSDIFKTSQLKNKFKKKKLPRAKQFSMNIDAMRSFYKTYSKSKLKLRTHFKKPIDERTFLPILVPKENRELMLIPRSSLKERAAIHFSITDDNEKNKKTEVDEIIKKPLVVYDENFYQKLVRLYRPSIREKINLQRRNLLELQKQQKEAEEAETRARESIKRKTLFQSRSSLEITANEQLEDLVKQGLKSEYQQGDIVPSNIAVVDDYILKMAPKTTKVNIQNLISATKIEQPTVPESLKAKPRKSYKPFKKLNKKPLSSSKYKKLKLKKELPKISKSLISLQEDIESNKESLVVAKDLWNYNDDLEDQKINLPQDVSITNLDVAKTTKKKNKQGSRKNKKPWSKFPESSDTGDKNEHVARKVCSACGMTDMQPGGPCCPFIPKSI